MRHIVLGLLGFAGLALASGGAIAADSRLFYCGDGQGSIKITIVNSKTIKATIDIDGSADGRFTSTFKGGDNGSGYLVFVNGEYAIELDGDAQDTVHYTAPDFGDIYCVWDQEGPSNVGANFNNSNDDEDEEEEEDATASGFPMKARSCGGVVRSKPSMSSSKVTSLAEGTPITLLDYGPMMDDYSWFKIKLRNGKTGYQWGGILSPASGHLDGAYDGC